MINILNTENLITDIKNLGVSAATVFPPAEIKFDGIFRKMCKDNLCGRYGKNYKCPPFIGEPDDLKAEALSYDSAVLIQTIHKIEDSFDFEGMTESSKLFARTTLGLKEAFSGGDMMVLGAGGCSYCETCTYPDAPCAFPEKTNVSLEACGVNVSQLCALAGFQYINGANTVTYTGIVLF